MMFLEIPDGYREDFRVAACIIEAEWKILLFQQWGHKQDAGKWLEPGGKADTGENYENAMIREVFEETWIMIGWWEAMKLFRRYFHYHSMHITIEMYSMKYTQKPTITLSKEHSQYWWFSLQETLWMNLVEDLDCILQEIVW